MGIKGERNHQCGVHLFRCPTNDEGLFGLCSMFVVPGWAASGVDGSFGGA